MGGMPVLGRWDERRFDYIDLMAKMNVQGFDVLFGHGVWKGYHDNKRYYFQVDQAPLNFKREYLLDPKFDSFLTLYRNFAVDFMRALGSTATDIKKQMDDMIDFEIALAKVRKDNYNYTIVLNLFNKLLSIYLST